MGYGDEILATAEAKEAKKVFPEAKILIGNGRKINPSVIYLNNPNILQGNSFDEKEDNIWILNYLNNRPYIDYTKTNSERIIWDEKFSAKPGEIFLTDLEKSTGSDAIKQATKLWENNFSKKLKFSVVIEPNVKGVGYASRVGTTTVGDSNLNRDWGLDKWQKVVNALKDKIMFIQLFKGNVRKLSNVIQVDCNFRVALSILNASNLFLGTNGGFTQAAAALGIDAINIFGGWTSPSIVGYKFHTNFYIDVPGTPCGSKKICNHCQDCMKQIKTDDIISALKQRINSK